jgi:alpha-mannosidase
VAFVHAAGVSILLDHVTEYELVDGREVALTVLRSTGLISRNDNPFREDPAGPEVPVPGAQLIGPWSFSFGVLPHAGSWDEAGVLDAAEGYRLPFVSASGTGDGRDDAPSAVQGLRVSGNGVVLSALRRREDELEVRVVAETSVPTTAEISGRRIVAAREVDLLGRPVVDHPPEVDGTLRIPLGPWDIRTVRLRTADATPL